MRTINNSNWTQRNQILESLVRLHIGIAQAQNSNFGHPMCTVVINNPAANVEQYPSSPDRMVCGMVFSDRLRVRSLLGDRYSG